MQVTDDMVNRFLTWRLPNSVCADTNACIPGASERYGTSLLSASETREMLAHVLGAFPQPMTREFCAAFPGTAAGIINELARQIDGTPTA